MNKFLKFLFIAIAAVPFLASCSKNGDSDYPRYSAYMTLNTGPMGIGYYFTADNGKTYYPSDVSRIIPAYETVDDDDVSKDGKRVAVYYNLLNEEKEGYDYNIALYFIGDILSKTVEVAETEEEVTEAGDDRLDIFNAAIQGEWLDIVFDILTYESTHKMTLLDNQTADLEDIEVPEDYQYLEFRQKTESKKQETGTLSRGIVSFKLGEYHPKTTGSKGLYIRIKSLNGDVVYKKLDYKAGTSASLQINSIPTPNMDRIR